MRLLKYVYIIYIYLILTFLNLNTKSFAYFNCLTINCSVFNNLSLNRIHHIDDYFIEYKMLSLY